MTAYRRDDQWAQTDWSGSYSSDVPADQQHVPPRTQPVRPKVLARLPNLDVAELDKVVDAGPASGGGRKISQRISTAVLIGVGVLFFVVAVQPFLGSRGTMPEPPAPSAPLAPTWNASTAPSTSASDPTGGIPLQPSLPPIPASIPGGPMLPDSIPPVPDSIQSPAAGGAAPQGPVPNSQSQIPLPNNQTQVLLPTYPGQSSLPGSQTAAPVYPTTPYAANEPIRPNMGSYDLSGVTATANRAMTIAADRTADTRSAPAWTYPSTGSTTYGSGPSFSPVASSPAVAQPGVARLQGTIEKSTPSPNYDTTRPSLY